MTTTLRKDFDAPALRSPARLSKDAGQARRLLALAAIYAGGSRTDAAQLGGVTLQIIRDWVLKFNAHGPAGLIDRKPPGAKPLLTQAQRAALAMESLVNVRPLGQTDLALSGRVPVRTGALSP